MARDHDRHTVEVRYRTMKMAERDADRLRSCGWRVHEFGDEPILHVETYKPTSLFGDIDLRVTRRPLDGASYREAEAWKRGIVCWSLACGCEPSRLDTDYRLAGVQARLQPVGRDGKVFFGAADYVIERMSWSCIERDNRVNVCVRLPEDDGWRGRMIMVAEEVIETLLKDAAA